MNDLNRQLRLAIIIFLTVVPIGVTGFIFIEGLSPLDALWLTIITLTTIGYGDISAETDFGRIFTIGLVLVGLSAIGFTLQTFLLYLASPQFYKARQQRRIWGKVRKLENHYVICGRGELVDKTINYLQQSTKREQVQNMNILAQPVDRLLGRIIGSKPNRQSFLRRSIRFLYLFLRHPQFRRRNLLDTIVVITNDTNYAAQLRDEGFLIIEGDPTNEETLKHAGIFYAKAAMVLLDSDTDTLHTVLKANKLNPSLYLTASVISEKLRSDMNRLGANAIIAPFDVAAQFLTNATLRPIVYEFFNNLLFDYSTDQQVVPIQLGIDSPWINKEISELELFQRFEAAVIGVRHLDGTYEAVPNLSHKLQDGETLLIVVPLENLQSLRKDTEKEITKKHLRYLNTASMISVAPPRREAYTIEESEQAIMTMEQHFIVCGTGHIVQNIVNRLDPKRAFVIISDDRKWSQELLERGFRVIWGSPTNPETLDRAGLRRAQAIMVSIENEADAVITVLNCRAISETLLITASANSDDMIEDLEIAGVDRMVSPFHVAAQFVLAATMRPALKDFMEYITFNYETGLETLDIFMEDSSPWIGETIESLQLDNLFKARVISIRLDDQKTYILAPSSDYIIKPHEVLIVVAPMSNFDNLHLSSYGSVIKQPITLRDTGILRSTNTSSFVKRLFEDAIATQEH